MSGTLMTVASRLKRPTLFLGLILVASPALAGQPTITLGERELTIDGATPGHALVWFGVGRSTPRWIPRIVSEAGLVENTDASGSTVVTLGVDIAHDSIWVAADVQTGQFAVASPDGAEPRQVSPELRDLVSRPGQLTLPSGLLESRRLHILVVRRGVGGWSLLSRDGGPYDREGASLGQILDFVDLKPLGASMPPLTELLPGDILAVVDSHDMRHFIVRVGAL